MDGLPFLLYICTLLIRQAVCFFCALVGPFSLLTLTILKAIPARSCLRALVS